MNRRTGSDVRCRKRLDLRQKIDVQAPGIGAYYNPDEPSITNLYKDQGYLTSQIDPAEIIIGKDSIDLEVRVFEGKQFTINNVGISGNMRLDER